MARRDRSEVSSCAKVAVLARKPHTTALSISLSQVTFIGMSDGISSDTRSMHLLCQMEVTAHAQLSGNKKSNVFSPMPPRSMLIANECGESGSR